MIQLVGPGGAGKSTIGVALAERLGLRFGDSDAEFTARHGNISAYLDAHGYEAYSRVPQVMAGVRRLTKVQPE